MILFKGRKLKIKQNTELHFEMERKCEYSLDQKKKQSRQLQIRLLITGIANQIFLVSFPKDSLNKNTRLHAESDTT